MYDFEIIAIGEIDPDTLSSGIQAWINENYSHLAVLVDGKRVFHATEKGFHESTLEKELEGSVIRHRIKIHFNSDLERAEALGWLRGKIGAKYGWLQYVGYFFPFINHLKWVKNNRSETVCSEVVADWLYDCAPDYKNDSRIAEADFLSPKDVIQLLLASQ